VTALDRHQADLANGESLRTLILSSQPDVILNAAAYTQVDKAESEAALASRINATAPGTMARAAREIGAWFIHYSTDYVFDGAKGSPYLETDSTHPLSVYGQSKLRGEEAVQSAAGRYLIFRLSWVYSTRGRNFLLTMQKLAREGKTLRVVNDQFGSPTWARLAAEATAAAVASVTRDKENTVRAGLYHMTGGGVTSWHGFASRIINALPESERRVSTVHPITTADYPTPARRPPYSVLDSAKLEKFFGIVLPSWQEGLRVALGEPHS
jgi:dTDP-4-dehydrorhamnose reductase